MIFELSLAKADATPPEETEPVPKLTLMMSHRMSWLLAEALKLGESPAGLDASIVEAGFPFSHPRARLISATPASPAIKVRAFIECSSFYVFPTVGSAQSVSTRLFRCTGGARAVPRGKFLRDLMGGGGTARTDLATHSGGGAAGKIAARPTSGPLWELGT